MDANCRQVPNSIWTEYKIIRRRDKLLVLLFAKQKNPGSIAGIGFTLWPRRDFPPISVSIKTVEHISIIPLPGASVSLVLQQIPVINFQKSVNSLYNLLMSRKYK